MNYYNENDPKAAAWLRELIKAGHIPPGDVDERSIVDVKSTDLARYRQCHFFAGVAGWSHALHLAGWPEDREVWTGSCPCQPYSVGSVAHGGAKGQADERHLWPPFFNLIKQRKPATVFGEQVSSAIEWGWWDEVALDLEGEAYAVASAVIPALFVKTGHERKRLWWVANSSSSRRSRHQPLKCVSKSEAEAFSIHGDPIIGARRAMAGDLSDLLPFDGLSVAMARSIVKGFGNAIVPQVAAEFIIAFLETIE